jgi:glycosyltransferase involved in cell wall biosynthesis
MENPLKPLPGVPLVTIVTPSYNTGRYIEHTLRSVQQQDWPRIEHIVLDAGSTDETLEILARFPSVRLIRNAEPTAIQKTNHGFAIATGDIVGWLCADDCYLPGAVTKAVEALRSNPDAALVYSNFLQVDESGREFRRRPSKQADWRNLVDEANYVPTEGAFVRREALLKAGPLDARYPQVDDWDLWIRIAKLFPIRYIDDWWGAFRVHSGQRSAVYAYEFWFQGRRMTREHGGRFFSPLFFRFWRTKLFNALSLLRAGNARAFGAKLRSLLIGISPARPRE